MIYLILIQAASVLALPCVKTSGTSCAYWDDNHKAFEKELPGKAGKLLSQTSGVESCVMLKHRVPSGLENHGKPGK